MHARIVRKPGNFARILAIGDIHGCAMELRRLLKTVQPTGDDLIVTLGDYIDRGPNTKGVLEILMDLNQAGNLVALRGNHDAFLLMAAEGIEPAAYYPEPPADAEGREMWEQITQIDRVKGIWLQNNGGLSTLRSYGLGKKITTVRLADQGHQPAAPNEVVRLVPLEHMDFLRNQCVDALETDRFIFAHAGLAPWLPLDEQPLFGLHWLRGYESHQSGKKVVVGHTIQHNFRPKDMGHNLFMDTGCFMGGRLTCMDVQTGQYWQK